MLRGVGGFRLPFEASVLSACRQRRPQPPQSNITIVTQNHTLKWRFSSQVLMKLNASSPRIQNHVPSTRPNCIFHSGRSRVLKHQLPSHHFPSRSAAKHQSSIQKESQIYGLSSCLFIYRMATFGNTGTPSSFTEKKPKHSHHVMLQQTK